MQNPPKESHIKEKKAKWHTKTTNKQFISMMLATVFGTTLDNAVTLSQIQSQQRVLPIMRNLYLQHGIKGWFRGGFCGFSGRTLYYFTTFHNNKMLREKLITSDSISARVAAASVASVTSTIIVNPFFVAKIRYQSDILHRELKKRPTPPHLWQCWRDMVCHEGWRSLSKGVIVSSMQALRTGFELPLADELREMYAVSPGNAMLLSRFVVNSVTYPLETIRNVQRHNDNRHRLSLSVVVKALHQDGGIMRFYRGFTWNMIRTLPMAMLTYSIYTNLTT